MLWILSDMINYDLYMNGYDKAMAAISLSSIIVMLVMLFTTVPIFSVYGALLSTAVTFLYLIFVRYIYAKKNIQKYSLKFIY